MSDKPIIKTANERLSDYLKNLDPHFNQFAIAAVTEKVLPQFQTEEIRELRTAYEALQKENVELKRNITNALKERKHQEDSNIKLREESAAQAKLIEAIETLCTHDYESKDDFISRVKERLKNGDSK